MWATIDTSCNQDGCVTKPITAPSGDQQLQLIQRMYESNQFSPCDIQYIEAHGKPTILTSARYATKYKIGLFFPLYMRYANFKIDMRVEVLKAQIFEAQVFSGFYVL